MKLRGTLRRMTSWTSERDEHTEAYLSSCTSTKVSHAQLTPLIGYPTGISGHAYTPHHSIQTSTVYIRICEHTERETSKVQDYCGEEPVQAIGKLYLWQIRGDRIETNESEVSTTWNEREAIIQKHEYDMIAGTTMYSKNLIDIKLNTPVHKVVKPFFIGLLFWTCPNTSSTISTTTCSKNIR